MAQRIWLCKADCISAAYLRIRKVTISRQHASPMRMYVHVTSWACLLFVVSVCIPSTSRITTASKSSVAGRPGVSSRFASGIKGVCICFCDSYICIAFMCICLHERQGRQGYHREAVFSLIPSHYSCIIWPPLANIFLLTVCYGIPNELLCVSQSGRLAIKSS